MRREHWNCRNPSRYQLRNVWRCHYSGRSHNQIRRSWLHRQKRTHSHYQWSDHRSYGTDILWIGNHDRIDYGYAGMVGKQCDRPDECTSSILFWWRDANTSAEHYLYGISGWRLLDEKQ